MVGPQPTEPLLTKEQVAEQMQISVRSVQRLVAAGELRAIQVGRAVRFDPADVRAFIDARRT